MRTAAGYWIRNLAFFALLAIPAACFHASEKAPGENRLPLKVLVAPVKMAVTIKTMKDIGEATDAVPQDEGALREKIARIENRTSSALSETLRGYGQFEVLDDVRPGETFFLDGKRRFLNRLSSETISAAAPSGADVVVAVKISGYGRIKKEWVALLIGSGVLEGFFHGALLLKATSQTSLAIGAALGEIASESVRWGGGAYLFGKKFTPVVLEAAVYDAKTGARIFRTSAFASARKKYFKDTPEDLRSNKAFRLETVLGKALEKIGRRIGKAGEKIRRHVTPDAGSKVVVPSPTGGGDAIGG